MKTLKFTSLTLLIMALMSFTGTPILIASSNDDSHLSQNDSIYSPPGYMNKDIQQARTLTDKYLANKDKADQKTEATQRDVSQKVEVRAAEKPQLKQKQSARSSTAKSQVVTADPKNVNIGTGANQEKDASGRIISEVIGGQRYVYAGFSNVGKSTINDAIGVAIAGDKVIVKAGTYDGVFTLKDGVNLYGGYDESGRQDRTHAPTIINGGFKADSEWTTIDGVPGADYSLLLPTEISGFTINVNENGDGALRGIEVNAAKHLTISDNIFNGGSLSCGVVASSSDVVVKNNVFNTGYGIYVSGDAGGYRMLTHYNESDSATSSEHNDFNGIYGIKVAGNIIGLSSSNDYFNTKYRTVDGNDNDVFAPPPSVEPTQSGGLVLARNIHGPDAFVPEVNPGLISITDTIVRPNALDIATTGTSFKNIPLYNAFSNYDSASPFVPIYVSTTKEPGTLAAGKIFKNLLNSKDVSTVKDAGQADSVLLIKLSEDAIRQSALTISRGQMSGEAMDVAMRLASILSNPTDDQKVVLDSVKALLNEIKNVEDRSGNQSPELAKASDDLLQMVASILLAQGVPDLLKSGDVSNIRAIFQELDQTRAKIMLEYTKGTKPYYENMIKDLAKNMAMLQGKNLLNPNITKDELSKLPPSELDKILEKIKNMKDRSFEEEYLLQQESKYRKDYLDPNKKKLENDMKDMLKSFTERLNDVLKTTDKK